MNDERRSAPDLIAVADARVESAIRDFKPVALFGMFSGGHDSLTAGYIASRASQFQAQCHINTGIGVEETRRFVRETCSIRGWPLLEYKAAENVRADGTLDPQIYDDLVMEHGFPGPAHHWKMYQRLKERQIERLIRDHKRRYSREVVLLVSGRRSQESARRAITVTPQERKGGRAWVNPIHDFSKRDCHVIMEYAGLARNPVVDLIHKSGECLCGAFAKPGELAELSLWFPETAARIRRLEEAVRLHHPWGWGERPPRPAPPPKCRTAASNPKSQALCQGCLLQPE